MNLFVRWPKTRRASMMMTQLELTWLPTFGAQRHVQAEEHANRRSSELIRIRAEIASELQVPAAFYNGTSHFAPTLSTNLGGPIGLEFNTDGLVPGLVEPANPETPPKSSTSNPTYNLAAPARQDLTPSILTLAGNPTAISATDQYLMVATTSTTTRSADAGYMIPGTYTVEFIDEGGAIAFATGPLPQYFAPVWRSAPPDDPAAYRAEVFTTWVDLPAQSWLERLSLTHPEAPAQFGELLLKENDQLLDLKEVQLARRSIIPHAVAARQATVIGDRIVSISAAELLSVQAIDRDQPLVKAALPLLDPVDQVFVLGNRLIEIAKEIGADVRASRPKPTLATRFQRVTNQNSIPVPGVLVASIIDCSGPDPKLLGQTRATVSAIFNQPLTAHSLTPETLVGTDVRASSGYYWGGPTCTPRLADSEVFGIPTGLFLGPMVRLIDGLWLSRGPYGLWPVWGETAPTQP